MHICYFCLQRIEVWGAVRHRLFTNACTRYIYYYFSPCRAARSPVTDRLWKRVPRGCRSLPRPELPALIRSVCTCAIRSGWPSDPSSRSLLPARWRMPMSPARLRRARGPEHAPRARPRRSCPSSTLGLRISKFPRILTRRARLAYQARGNSTLVSAHVPSSTVIPAHPAVATALPTCCALPRCFHLSQRTARLSV